MEILRIYFYFKKKTKISVYYWKKRKIRIYILFKYLPFLLKYISLRNF